MACSGRKQFGDNSQHFSHPTNPGPEHRKSTTAKKTLVQGNAPSGGAMLSAEGSTCTAGVSDNH